MYDQFQATPRLVPTWCVIIVCDIVESHQLVMKRPQPFDGIDDSSLEIGIDLTPGDQHRSSPDLFQYPTGQPGYPHFEGLEIVDRIDLFVEPTSHLNSGISAYIGPQVKSFIDLSPEFDASAMVDPGGLFHGVESKRYCGEKLSRRYLPGPVIGSSMT